MTTRRKPPARRAESSGPSPVAIAVVVAVLAAAAGGWYLWTREDRVATTLELQQRLLADELSGRQARVAIDRIIRNVDTMTPAEAQQVRESIGTALRQLHEASMDAYFAAPLTGKQAVLDEALDRQEVLGELRFAISGNSWGERRRRPPQKPGGERRDDKPAAPKISQEEKDLAKLRRELSGKYFEALATRAKQRGIELTSRR